MTGVDKIVGRVVGHLSLAHTTVVQISLPGSVALSTPVSFVEYKFRFRFRQRWEPMA